MPSKRFGPPSHLWLAGIQAYSLVFPDIQAYPHSLFSVYCGHVPPRNRKTEGSKVQKPPKVHTWVQPIKFAHKPKPYRQPRDPSHPLQQVRQIVKMSQEDFAASLGLRLDHYKHIIDGRQKIPDELKAKVFDRYGAIVTEHTVPAQAFGPRGFEPFTKKAFQDHRDMFKPLWEPFRIEEAIRAFRVLADAVRERAKDQNDSGLLRLLRMEYVLALERLTDQFGVYEEVRNQIMTLRHSRDAGDIRLCYLLCKITHSDFLLGTLHRNPEHNRLERAGLLAASQEGKIGTWFKDYAYPAE
jgi:hypothetical protein